MKGRTNYVEPQRWGEGGELYHRKARCHALDPKIKPELCNYAPCNFSHSSSLDDLTWWLGRGGKLAGGNLAGAKGKNSELGALGFGFRDWGLGLRVWDVGFGSSSLGI